MVEKGSESTDLCVTVAADVDIVAARQCGRAFVEQIGFSASEATLVATAISELARNIVRYAGRGEILLTRANGGGRSGVIIVARDFGPGIEDIGRAIHRGFSTAGGLGLGLPGMRQIMDEFDISSTVGSGTTVSMVKWRER